MRLHKYFLFLACLVFLSSCTSTQDTLIATQIFDNDMYASSSKLEVNWEQVEAATSYIVRYKENSDSSRSTAQELSFSAQETSTILLNLKSGTTYSLEALACFDSACTSSQSLGTTTAQTEEEYWQLDGDGNGYDSVTQIVNKGSALSYALISPITNDEVILYYSSIGSLNPQEQSFKGGVAIAVLSSKEGALGPDAFEVQEEYGLQHLCFGGSKKGMNTETTTSCGIEVLTQILASQAVPLASGVVRIFFEAEGQDGHVRIMSIDSADGLTGLDFNTGEETSCTTTEDYKEYCALTIHIGLTGDTTNGDSGLTEARQFKIGYPKQESWIWDESEGTFMVITGADNCETTNNGLFYALFDGEEWIVEKDDEDCALSLVDDGHGPVVVDMSTSTYKLYYEDESQFRDDKSAAKPLKLLYGNTETTGDSTVMEIMDWEAEAEARNVHFLWPDGSVVSAANEAGFGDHYIYFPTNDVGLQIMYLNLGGFDDSTWKKPSYGLGMARLVNP